MTQFSDLNLSPKVLKAVEEAGYTTPTPIQEGAIPHALAGRDVLGIAQTGTGKTASFTLPMITMLARGRARARMPRSLVLCPTRELAAQVAENFETYAKYVKLTKALLIGGVSFKEQDMLIDRGVDVLIATPGRLLDHFERGKLLLTGVQIMVVDEADRMLDMGFIPDIERIFGLVPFTRQTLFFSATMAPEIERITNTFLSNPAKIEVARQASASETITQKLISFKPTRRETSAADKREMLRQSITAEGAGCTNAIIFSNRKVDVDVVAKSLKKHGLNAEPIHGDLDQSQRTRTLDGFRDGSIRFLVASDVAARGLDIPNVSHVFNYDVPSHAEDYIHRIGRTGRAGRTGTAITLAVPSDDKYLAAIETLLGAPIPRAEAPWLPGGGSAAPAADTETEATTRDRKPRRTRSRRDERPAADAAPAVAETPSPQPAVAPAEARNTRTDTPPDTPDERVETVQREERSDPNQRSDRNEGRERNDRGERNDRNGQRNNRGGRDRGDRGERGPRALGMGDHMPDFISMSFDERRGGPARVTPDDDDTPEMDDVVETDVVETDVSETKDAAPKPKRKRVKKPKDAATTDTDKTDAA